MLSEAEQRRLTEIERALRSEDPAFAQRLGHGMRHGPRTWRSMTTRGWLITSALTMALAVMMASGALVVLALAVAGVSAGMWLAGYGRSAEGRSPSPR